MPKDYKTLLKVRGASLPNEPTAISPETEIIRNIERALDGTACIDWVSEKTKLNIVWDMLSSTDYSKTLKTFLKSCVLSIELMAGVIADAGYTSDSGKFTATSVTKNYYVDGITATPMIIDEEFYWQNVNITLLEV